MAGRDHNAQAQGGPAGIAYGVYARLVRWAFARFYRELAWTYDTVAAIVSGGQWPQWSLAALPFLRGRVLELGCGTGVLQLALASRPQHAAVGLDVSRQMLGLTRGRLARRGLAAQLVRASAGAAPLPAAAFDTVAATFPSEYIVAPAAVAEVARVLRPGGRLVVVLSAQMSGGGLYRRALDLLYRATLQRPVLAHEPPPAPTSLVGQRYAQAGFAVRELWHPVGGASLHIILAERPSAPQPHTQKGEPWHPQ